MDTNTSWAISLSNARVRTYYTEIRMNGFEVALMPMLFLYEFYSCDHHDGGLPIKMGSKRKIILALFCVLYSACVVKQSLTTIVDTNTSWAFSL